MRPEPWPGLPRSKLESSDALLPGRRIDRQWARRKRQAYAQAKTLVRKWLGAQRAASFPNPLFEPAQAAAWLRRAALAVVDDIKPRIAVVLEDANRAARRPAMAHDVGCSFADRPGEHRLDRSGQPIGLLLDAAVNPGGRHGLPCASELSGKRWLPVIRHGLANLAQGITGDFLDLLHLMGCQFRCSVDQPARQFALQRNHRQAVADQVV